MTTDAEREAFEAATDASERIDDRAYELFQAGIAYGRAALPVPQPDPVADDLVEWLKDMAPEADDMPSTRDVMLKAAARITSDAATIAAKDEEIMRFRSELDRLGNEADGEFVNAAVRVMQANPGFNYRDYADGITADDFEEFFTEDMNEAWRCYRLESARADASKARASELQAEVERLRGRYEDWRPINETPHEIRIEQGALMEFYWVEDGADTFLTATWISRPDEATMWCQIVTPMMNPASYAALNTGESDAG